MTTLESRHTNYGTMTFAVVCSKTDCLARQKKNKKVRNDDVLYCVNGLRKQRACETNYAFILKSTRRILRIQNTAFVYRKVWVLIAIQTCTSIVPLRHESCFWYAKRFFRKQTYVWDMNFTFERFLFLFVFIRLSGQRFHVDVNILVACPACKPQNNEFNR